MDADSVDLIVTSPPYGNLRDYQGYEFDFGSIAKELYRVTKPGGIVVWVVNDQVIDGGESGESFKQALRFKETGFTLWDTMIYEKSGIRYPEKKRYYQCWEYMFVLSRGTPKTVNLITDRRSIWSGTWGKQTSRQKNGILKSGNKILYHKLGVRRNVWRMDSGNSRSTSDKIAYQHPAIFPDALARDHIISWSNEQDVVLDPMCGSGTTCAQSVLLNRQFIGIDVSKEYCELSRKRVAMAQDVMKQGSLL